VLISYQSKLSYLKYFTLIWTIFRSGANLARFVAGILLFGGLIF